MAKMIKVTNCHKCPNLTYSGSGNKYFCGHRVAVKMEKIAGQLMYVHKLIPRWCPLPDAPKKGA